MKRTNRMRESLGSRCFSVAVVVMVTLITIVCFYPMYDVLAASFSDPVLLLGHRGGGGLLHRRV